MKMQEGSETPSETSPPAAAEGGETVEISKEELRQLAEAAGIKVKTTSEIIQEERTARREAELEAARGPNAFTPFIEALKPVLELPPLIQYPVLLVIFGVSIPPAPLPAHACLPPSLPPHSDSMMPNHGSTADCRRRRRRRRASTRRCALSPCCELLRRSSYNFWYRRCRSRFRSSSAPAASATRWACLPSAGA